MCDSLCAIGPDGALFAKNSDRPSAEVQLIESHAARSRGGKLRTQYLEIEDTGAAAAVGARPAWLWGMEHGVNEHRVAIGNEKVYTKLNANKEPPALIGMDIVRLGLERARTADEALEVMTSALERHGQGGICDETTGEAYFSSFLICDPHSGWVLETSGRSWVAAPVQKTAAISNRLTIGREWTRASSDVPTGADWDEWRHPRAPTGHADNRLASSKSCLASGEITPASLATHLRDHGGDGIPQSFDETGRGVTVCMHLRGFQNTTSAMIAELPADADRPLRAWVAPGQPCVSVFVPVFPPHVPAALADVATWQAFASLRNRAEADPGALAEIRAIFAPVEAELWAEADDIAMRPERHAAFVEDAWRRVTDALGRTSVGSGRS